MGTKLGDILTPAATPPPARPVPTREIAETEEDKLETPSAALPPFPPPKLQTARRDAALPTHASCLCSPHCEEASVMCREKWGGTCGENELGREQRLVLVLAERIVK